MDQDATWYGGKPWARRHCVRWGSSSPKGAQPHFLTHVYCGPTVTFLSCCRALVICCCTYSVHVICCLHRVKLLCSVSYFQSILDLYLAVFEVILSSFGTDYKWHKCLQNQLANTYIVLWLVTTPTHVEWTGVHVAHSDVDLKKIQLLHTVIQNA